MKTICCHRIVYKPDKKEIKETTRILTTNKRLTYSMTILSAIVRSLFVQLLANETVGFLGVVALEETNKQTNVKQKNHLQRCFAKIF